MNRCLRLILGDQLSPHITSLQDADPGRDLLLMAEVKAETTYVRHHRKKIALVFAAMRHFAEGLESKGYKLVYRRYDSDPTCSSLLEAVRAAVAQLHISRLVVTEPSEWRLRREMENWAAELGIPVEIREDRRFICSHDRFARWTRGRKTLRMEHFYRALRRETGLLMEEDQPAGGQWNYDRENRKALPRVTAAPEVPSFEPDGITREVLQLVGREFDRHFGMLEPFTLAATADQADTVLTHFLEKGLPFFGDYQDAMKQGAPVLFHAMISAYLNIGLLDPLEVCRRAEQAWREGRAPLNAVEGFIRQILGWREYVRGLYWQEMPGYAELNALAAERPLPAFYWTGETEMNCLRHVIGETHANAYAHHIQRLMVTGNFALLAGLDPKAVNAWYMVVYADAYEWVELPNTHGMALHADGGLMASKPYAASGKYIDRMSDYCRNCRYDVKQATGEGACPFNYLYWDFIARHEQRFRGNPRMTMPLSTLHRMKPEKLEAMRVQAEAFLEGLDYAEEGEWT
ncbi:MAG: cryptochrome/photolyase family protein [Pseudomonadota bacterium]